MTANDRTLGIAIGYFLDEYPAHLPPIEVLTRMYDEPDDRIVLAGAWKDEPMSWVANRIIDLANHLTHTIGDDE